jgi:competence protein ComEA
MAPLDHTIREGVMNPSLASVAVVLALAAVAPAAATTRTDEVVVAIAGERVNVNTASVKELMTLEGIGRKLAEKIVEHRKANGPFGKPSDVRKVPGMDADVWLKNRERIVVK